MLQHKRLVLICLLLLETLAAAIVGCYCYTRFFQQSKQLPQEPVVKLDKAVFQSVATTEFEYFFEPSPNITNTATPSWLGYQNSQTYNEDGFNERFNYPVEKSPDTLRIITIGDSFTHGDFVPTPKNWTELLEDSLNMPTVSYCGRSKVEVINLGMSGYDVQYIARRYVRKGAKYQPDLILWFESGSGFERLNELTQKKIADCEANEVTKEMNDIEKTDYYFRCWETATNELKKHYSPHDIQMQINRGYQEFFQVAAEIPTVIIGYRDPPKENYKAMTNLYLKNQPNVQYLPVMPNITPDIQLRDGHPTLEGHAIMAEVFRQQLLQLQPKICPK